MMKKMMSLMILALMMTGSMANATSLRRTGYSTAELTHFNIDERHTELKGIDGANITVDHVLNTVTLQAWRRMNCAPNRICPRFMPAPVTITLPLVMTTKDDCGSKIYTARKDLRPVDGILNELIVTDNVGNKCPHFRALADTEVVYSTKGVRTQFEAASTFEGNRLIRQY